MSEQDEKIGAVGSNSISDETIRRCLLGCAAPDEQARFEELLLLDDAIEKRVRLAELELADDFSFGRLSTDERELFRNNFLVTEERGQKLAVSRALRRVLSHPSAETAALNETQVEVGNDGLPRRRPNERQGTARWRLTLSNLFGYGHPAVSFALAVAALVLFAGLLWLLMKSPRVRPEVVQRPAVASPDREYAHPPRSQTPSGSESAITPNEAAPVAILLLQPDVRFDEQAIHLAAPLTESDTLRLQLLLQGDETATYQGRLFTAGSQQVAVISELRPVTADQQLKIVWDLPVRLLSPGDYQVILEWMSGEQTQKIGRYNFRIK